MFYVKVYICSSLYIESASKQLWKSRELARKKRKQIITHTKAVFIEQKQNTESPLTAGVVFRASF